MQLQRALNAFKKNNIEVTTLDKWGNGYLTYIAKKGDRQLEFHENGRGSGNLTTFIARHPDTNAMYDLFMDTYFESIKYAVKYLEGAGAK